MENKVNKIDLNYVVTMCVIKKKNITDIVTFRTYIPIREKLEEIDKYIRSLQCYIKGTSYVDSFEQYFKFTMMAIQLYTNIKLDVTYEEYDLLVQYGLLNDIFTYVRDDYEDFKDVMEMKLNDYLRKNMLLK